MDPLRPFTTLIRSLWVAGKPRAGAARETTLPPVAAAAVLSIESRLRLRLGTVSPWQANRAREIFVETVLSNALSAELEADPDFQPWVREVSAHLASVEEVSSRLDELLQSLQRDAPGP
jgi:hypothetical protein